MTYKPPFPWFGGKSRIAPVVWRALGADVPNLGDGKGKENAHRERLWFSPHCVRPQTSAYTQRTLIS
jgi:hypothetical protein